MEVTPRLKLGNLYRMSWVFFSPFFQPVEVPSHSSHPVQCINLSSQFSIFHKFMEGLLYPLYPIIQIINKHIKLYWPQYRSLKDTMSNWLPGGLCTANHYHFSLTVQLIFFSQYHSLIQSISCQFGCKVYVSKTLLKTIQWAKCTLCTFFSLKINS